MECESCHQRVDGVRLRDIHTDNRDTVTRALCWQCVEALIDMLQDVIAFFPRVQLQKTHGSGYSR